MQCLELLHVKATARVLPAASTELPEIVSLLAAAGLPVADLAADGQVEFLVARLGQRVVGVVGLERFGEFGLLRSLAVSKPHQGLGLGLALTQALEEHAASTGMSSLVLLTETASEFFRRHGYQVVPRDQAPLAVLASSEFRSLCPQSALCLIKRL
jgi:amino-acid N-acetyltransferase